MTLFCIPKHNCKLLLLFFLKFSTRCLIRINKLKAEKVTSKMRKDQIFAWQWRLRSFVPDWYSLWISSSSTGGLAGVWMPHSVGAEASSDLFLFCCNVVSLYVGLPKTLRPCQASIIERKCGVFKGEPQRLLTN